jgi:glycosyltransferase involved in cell wall biosynthesis
VKLNVLWLSHLVPYPPRAGVAQRSYGLLREIGKYHDVTLMAFHQPELMKIMSRDPERELEEAVRRLSEICTRVAVFDLPSERSKLARYSTALQSLFRKHPYTINWVESADYSRALAAEAARGYDLVHFDTISLAEYRLHFPHVPLVMNHHNIESHLLERRAAKTRSWLARTYLRQEATRLRGYEQDTAQAFTLHVTCSELDADRLRSIRADAPVVVVPNGVDLGYFTRAAPVTAPRPAFAFVGTLGWGPNRDAAEMLARSVWPALAAEWPTATMDLVGSRPPPVASALARTDPRFTVTGFVDDERPYLAGASFFLCPIKDGGGTKLKILNAMAMGSVVIADPIACEGIDATPGVELMTAATTADYVAAARALLSEPERYLAMAAAARKRIEQKYSYAAIGLALKTCYESVVESFRSGGRERCAG